MSESRTAFFAQLDELSFKDAGKIATLVNRAGDAWAIEEAKASSMEEQKKNFWAKLVVDYLTTGGDAPTKPGGAPKAMPMSQAEIRAYADPRYAEYVQDMVAARERATRARVRYDLGKLYIEMQRSNSATKRQELQTLGTST